MLMARSLCKWWRKKARAGKLLKVTPRSGMDLVPMTIPPVSSKKTRAIHLRIPRFLPMLW
jgi:hypothetical protein